MDCTHKSIVQCDDSKRIFLSFRGYGEAKRFAKQNAASKAIDFMKNYRKNFSKLGIEIDNKNDDNENVKQIDTIKSENDTKANVVEHVYENISSPICTSQDDDRMPIESDDKNMNDSHLERALAPHYDKLRTFFDLTCASESKSNRNPVSQLMEISTMLKIESPSFKCIYEYAQPEDPKFVFETKLESLAIAAHGTGSKKKYAKRFSAKNTLEKMKQCISKITRQVHGIYYVNNRSVAENERENLMGNNDSSSKLLSSSSPSLFKTENNENISRLKLVAIRPRSPFEAIDSRDANLRPQNNGKSELRDDVAQTKANATMQQTTHDEAGVEFDNNPLASVATAARHCYASRSSFNYEPVHPAFRQTGNYRNQLTMTLLSSFASSTIDSDTAKNACARQILLALLAARNYEISKL
ncbi:hypothetical protein B4U80_11734 [Leptotrombidium deliense]|uniref:DRBM domain-containing protein n=1 Tax=Leptotrombidium deliense TaxID=299467 RepID=A0A443STT3_9ACAR|nr:hypothetical protein B4U80_11734 [Leptotrombidium deliense]